MACVSPPELDDRQLLAYLDGEADPQVASHLKQCPHCREKADALARLSARLTARLYRLTCPSPAELGEYHLGLLLGTQAGAISQHLAECPHCTRELTQLKDYLGELAPELELSLGERARVLVARWVGGKEADSPPGRLALAPAFAGIRGSSRGPITLEADSILIVLDIHPAAEGRVTMLGQVAADDQDRWTGARVELRQTGTLPTAATVDDLGAFRFQEVFSGSTEIMITSTHGIVVQIPSLDIVV